MSEKEFYNITELAEILNISRPTVYAKLKQIDADILQTLCYKDKNITYYSRDILHYLQEPGEQTGEDKQEGNTNIPLLTNKLIESIIEQLKVKDNQIQEKDNQIKELHQIVQNSQILLKDKQPVQDIKELEEHFQDLDSKLLDLREQMQRRKDQKQNNIFKRLFKK